MIEGGAKWIYVFLAVSILLTTPSCGYMGYDIIARVDSKTWELHRHTQEMSLSIDGSVSGVGNFSRLSKIQGFTGIEAKESSSSRKGSLDYDEKIYLRSLEGPVTFTINLASEEYLPPNQTEKIISGNAHIEIDEIWPTYFANYKKILYQGSVIRASERYENNGDIFATSIDSKQLSKESLYRAHINRTLFEVDITPQSLVEDRRSNKSSNYALALKSTGSLTHIGVIRQDLSGEVLSQISEDYRGEVSIGLRARMDESVRTPAEKAFAWLPCCHGGYFDMSEGDRKSSSAHKIFDCTCRDYPSAI